MAIFEIAYHVFLMSTNFGINLSFAPMGATGHLVDTEVADELRRLNQNIRKLEYQAQIPICIWAFVGGMLVALGVMLKLYGMA